MYVGRIVAVARNRSGDACALYRVSSRSFPNRETRVGDAGVAVVPKPGFETDIYKNPYIAYNCLQQVGNDVAVVSNGSHTDILTGKMRDGMPIRDALISVLHSMDFEHDCLDTPRIAGVVNRINGDGWLGIVTRHSLHVTRFNLSPGDVRYVATYEHIVPGPQYGAGDFNAGTASDACKVIIGESIFADLERPIAAACALANDSGFDIAVADAPLADR